MQLSIISQFNLNLFKCARLFSTVNPPKSKGKKVADSKDKPSSDSTSAEDEHLFNIYAAIPQDHTLLPDECYPKWLWDLDKPEKTYGELLLMFVHGKNIENAEMKDYNRFRRLHNRTTIKLNNIRLQKQRKVSIKSHYWDV
ncbi:hypothetical protein BEWA_008230 [Theileria equi strain WA]|uniref:Large ribosomal subunit protein mL54 n=1 Tax=Theileria equi strain WA TaxID=1537102 RepID=L0B1R6_THEEQ|nr:hypothetical protein BEWA_008230 [Theileria equi strain WA]AFZ81413.1 hypothetical protein BEWA_008230 [Theileria equi strain WA]|eukprot:XP_004831079.1 hypothetical protein BEWA_008230 [Theileria equi strain WA]